MSGDHSDKKDGIAFRDKKKLLEGRQKRKREETSLDRNVESVRGLSNVSMARYHVLESKSRTERGKTSFPGKKTIRFSPV